MTGQVKFLALPVALLGAALLAAAPAPAAELRFETDNDFLMDNPTRDDLYSFAIGLAFDAGPYALALRENAFTDRAANLRFDETYLTAARDVPAPWGWQARATGGLVHIGHGLFGESAQNALHRVIDADEVHLDYVDKQRLYPTLALRLERPRLVARKLLLGPRVELSAIPDFRSHALLGVDAEWDVRGPLAIALMAGARFADASYPALVPHIVDRAFAGEVRLAFFDRIVFGWTRNAYGDGRNHLSIAYELLGGGDDRPRGPAER